MKYFTIPLGILIGLLLALSIATFADAEGWYSYQDSLAEFLGDMETKGVVQSEVMHDSGTISSVWLHLGEATESTEVKPFVYRCDQDMVPDFGQEIARGNMYVKFSATEYRWQRFDFESPFQVNVGDCISIRVGNNYSVEPDWNLLYIDWSIVQSKEYFQTNAFFIDDADTVNQLNGTLEFGYELDGDILYAGTVAIKNPTQDIATGIWLLLSVGVLTVLSLYRKPKRDMR